MFVTIKSKDNQILKDVRSLAKRKYREAKNKFVLEGKVAVREALEFALKPSYVIGTDAFFNREASAPIVAKAKERGVAIYQVSEKLFNGIAQTEEPQGVLLVLEKQESNWQELTMADNPLWLVVDGLQDPGNLGTIVRTAVAAGVDGLLITKQTVDVYNDKTLRSTMGAIFRTKLLQGVMAEDVVAYCKKFSLPIVVADPRGERPYYQYDFTKGMALVIGSENQGPGPVLTEHADVRVTIPMPGQMESLNAAVAAGILLYERVRQVK
ncbi:MAG: RNA methyltransferase [Clostridia bacterium]|jgi:TrmH family RNA methyltransferase|nr:RNA methyltransferase [Clostridia bacterium]